MSINVYLKGDEVVGIPGFKIKPRSDRGQQWEEYELPGIRLSRENGRWYIILHEPTDPVPASLLEIVEEISFFEWLSHGITRETGIYRYKTAEAELEKDVIERHQVRCKVRIRAKKMEDLLELHRLIKTGSIRPEQSYEGKQDGMSRNELEAELERTRETLYSLGNRHRETIGKIRGIADQLKVSRWRHVRTIGSKIITALSEN